MDHPPLALRLAAALAHATFAASVILPALVTVRCAVGADGADRRRARSWLRYWCVAGPLLALEASALGRFVYGALTLTGGDARVLGLAVLRFLVAERLATTSLCDELYEALEGFLVPREAKIRRGLDSLGEASVQAGKKAGAVVARTAASQSRELWRVARCAAAAKRVSDGLRARAAYEAAHSPGPKVEGGGAPAAEDELPFEPTPPTPPGRPAVAFEEQASGYLDDSGDETPTLGHQVSIGSRKTADKPRRRVRFAEKLDDKTPVKPVVPMIPKGLPSGDGISFCEDDVYQMPQPPTPQTPQHSRYGTLPSGDGVSFCSFAEPPPPDPARYAALPSGDGESFCEDDDNSPASVDTFEPKLDVLPSGDGDDDDVMARLSAGTVLSLGGMATGGPPCRRRVTLRRGHLEWSAPLETENGEGGAISLVAVEAVVAVGGKHRLRVRSATSQGADDLFVDCDSREDVPALRDGLEREASQAHSAPSSRLGSRARTRLARVRALARKVNFAPSA